MYTPPVFDDITFNILVGYAGATFDNLSLELSSGIVFVEGNDAGTISDSHRVGIGLLDLISGIEGATGISSVLSLSDSATGINPSPGVSILNPDQGSILENQLTESAFISQDSGATLNSGLVEAVIASLDQAATIDDLASLIVSSTDKANMTLEQVVGLVSQLQSLDSGNVLDFGVPSRPLSDQDTGVSTESDTVPFASVFGAENTLALDSSLIEAIIQVSERLRDKNNSVDELSSSTVEKTSIDFAQLSQDDIAQLLIAANDRAEVIESQRAKLSEEHLGSLAATKAAPAAVEEFTVSGLEDHSAKKIDIIRES